MRTSFAISSLLLLILACGGAAPAEPNTAAVPAASTAEPPAPQSGGAALTAEECEKQGGHVVGDIGDGAIHRPGYKCEGSGEPPLGPIKFEEGGPRPIEGAVCCR